MLHQRPEQGHFVLANRRLIEWLVVALVLAALVLVFLHQVRVLQRQAELASVKATLGALRTAFVMRHLQAQAAGEALSVATAQRNPFELLQQRPANYRGVIHNSDVARLPPGSWVYESLCGCVGYLPNDSGEFDSPSLDPMAWYVVDSTTLPFQLSAKETYFWAGQVLD